MSLKSKRKTNFLRMNKSRKLIKIETINMKDKTQNDLSNHIIQNKQNTSNTNLITFTHKKQLEFALNLIDLYHKNQKDKAGKEYRFHLMAVKDLVMNRMKLLRFSSEDVNNGIIVALLHDLLEDTDCPLELLETGISPENIFAIQLLTKKPKMTKEEKELYFENIKSHPLARQVKIADLIHNMNLQRLDLVTVKDLKRNENYLKNLEFLLLD